MLAAANKLHPIEAMPAAAENPSSVAYVDALVDVSEKIREKLPEYAGMTVYGSTVRGDTGPESDVDIHVFMETSDNSDIQTMVSDPDFRTVQIPFGPTEGTFYFATLIDTRYKEQVEDELVDRGFPTADITILPINKTIVEKSVESAAANVKTIIETGGESYLIPRNIRCLFNAPIEDERLQPYRLQALSLIKDSPYGKAIWMLLRQWISYYEGGRDNDDLNAIEHRPVPDTLADALEYYQVENGQNPPEALEYAVAIRGITRVKDVE